MRDSIITLLERLESLPPQHDLWRQSLLKIYVLVRQDSLKATVSKHLNLLGALSTLGQAVYSKLKELELLQQDLKRDAAVLATEMELRVVLNLLFEFLM